MSKAPYSKEDLRLLVDRLQYALEVFNEDPWLGWDHHGFEICHQHEEVSKEIHYDHKGREEGRLVTKTFVITCQYTQPSK